MSKRKPFITGSPAVGINIWTEYKEPRMFGKISEHINIFCSADGIAIDSGEDYSSAAVIDVEALPLLQKAITQCRNHIKAMRAAKLHARLQKLAKQKTPPEKVPELMKT